MRIAVIGGGPGGLFFAVLMKRADPSHEITVFERNAPEATFGFGVVFPERSMRYLREADAGTHEAFTQAMIQWDALEYRHRGRILRCGGHIFSGIARVDLLKILQQQARGLGVDLRFRHAINDLSEVSGYDLIVAADGINSLVRRQLADRFRPAVHIGRSKYIWLGTTQVFGALTFIFEETAHGWFGVHVYPYSATSSTFIVETNEDTWRQAGLDRGSDGGESERTTLDLCERLFARHLDGHPLLANTSRWLNFRTVRNRTWHAGNVALIGDAAHTAHFSVGSGTRMALEDAIALARAVQTHRTLAEALHAFEQERLPAVRRIQRAAEPSRRWWEGFRHWTRFEPEQFAFHHLARTRVLTYGTLRVRDPGFVRSAEAWFAGRAAPQPRHHGHATAPVQMPLQIGGVVFPNRVIAVARTTSSDGAGLVMVESVDAMRARSATRTGLLLSQRRGDGLPLADVLETLIGLARRNATAGIDLLVLDGAGSPDGGEVFLPLVDALRAVWPAGRLLGVRLEAWGDPEDDRAVDAGLAFARALGARGCDLIAVSMPRGIAARDPERAREAHAHTSDLIRNLAGLPTAVLGGNYTVGDINALILAGRADLCEWPRLAWPGWRPA